MSKSTKLLNDPKLFFVDAAKNRRRYSNVQKIAVNSRSCDKPIAILIGFSDWKVWMRQYLSDYEVVFLGHNPRVPKDLIHAIGSFNDPEIFVWSYKYPPYLDEYCARENLKITYVEDGFIRSFGLGVQKTQPLSLLFDSKGMHFDRSRNTDVEDILNSYDFAADKPLLDRARAMITDLCSMQVSKYNSVESSDEYFNSIPAKKNQKTVLVLGQVEDDLSLQFGMKNKITCNDLVMIAARENPAARILYRPHPESIRVNKKHYSNPADVDNICYVVAQTVSLHDCFAEADIAYTMTSLAGFEAALHGLKVKTFGTPFYAGWGITDDTDKISEKRRTRKLLLEEVFAGAYILYPRYLDPATNDEFSAEEALGHVAGLKHHMQSRIEADTLRAATKETEDAKIKQAHLDERIKKSKAHLEFFRSCRDAYPDQVEELETLEQDKLFDLEFKKFKIQH